MKNEVVVFDIECSCEDKTINKNYNMETIEIGAVKIKNGKIVEEFQTFVKPEYTEEITAFCTELTKITYKDLENAPSFKEAMLMFYDFAKDTKILSCGYFDKRFLMNEISEKGLNKENELGIVSNFISSFHSNLKVHYNNVTGFKQAGMIGMSNRLNVKLSGTHHRGIDDARNLGLIYIELESIREKKLRESISKKQINKLLSSLRKDFSDDSIPEDHASIASYSDFFDDWVFVLTAKELSSNSSYLPKDLLEKIKKYSVI